MTEVLSRPLIVSVLAAAVGLVCLRWGRRREAAVLAAALLVWIPERLMTEFIARERPTEAALTIIREGYGFAFPSGHTTGALVIYGALLLLLLGSRHRRRPAALAVCALAVAGLAGAGVGRVALGRTGPPTSWARRYSRSAGWSAFTGPIGAGSVRPAVQSTARAR